MKDILIKGSSPPDVAGADSASKAVEAPSPRKTIKVVRGYPLVGVLPTLLRDGPELISRVALEHPGEIVGVRLGPMTVYVVSHPDHAQHVLADRWRDFTKGGMWRAAEPVFGRGLISNDGDSWLRQRRLMQPLFSPTHLEALADVMIDTIAGQIKRIERDGADKVIEMSKEMGTLTEDVLFKTLFGTSLSQPEAERLGDQIHVAFRAMNLRIFLYFLPERFPVPGDRAYRNAVASIDEVVLRMVRARRQNGGGRKDVLSLLIHARDEGAEGMSDRQVRDEIVTLFVAGADSTAQTMTWLWYVLDQHRDVDRRLRAEVDEVLGERRPTYADLARLVYTRQVIQETMRLYPAGWMIPRVAAKAQAIGGYFIPEGSAILLCPLASQRDAAFWPDPERFDPERFASKSAAGRPRYTYYPFGGGPRQCIGNTLGMMMAQFATAMMVKRCRPRLLPGHRVVPASETLLKPRHGMKMTIERD
jgi:cytochrome P450